VDENIGRIRTALKQSGLADNTMFVVTSDHGEMLGERGLWYKMNFFEGSARVPLLFHAPGRFAQRRVAAAASLADILPTFVEIAGGDPADLAAGIDGRSLVPDLEGKESAGEAIGEYLAEGAIAPIVMIRRGAHKFVHSPADPDQLYDLAADPDETTNRSDDPAQGERVAAFRAEVEKRWDLAALDKSVRESQRRRHLVTSALSLGTQAPWDFQPFRDASNQYIRSHMDLDDLEARARYPRVQPMS
jgi:choline-sulfatase